MNVVEYTHTLTPLARNFDCGNPYLNLFLRSPDALNSSIGKTYVYLTEANDCILGYYNISAGSVDQLENGFRVKSGGAIHIGYFALDERAQHQFQGQMPDGTNLYLGDYLLIECLDRIEQIREGFVDAAVVTLASSEAGEHLYRKHDFLDLDDDLTFSLSEGEGECIPLYLPLDY